MARKSKKRVQASPEASWVLEGDAGSAFSGSDVASEDDAPLDTNSRNARRSTPDPLRIAPSKRTTTTSASQRAVKPAAARSGLSPRAPRYSEESEEPQFIMPSVDGPLSHASSYEKDGQLRRRTYNRLPNGHDRSRKEHVLEDENVSVYARVLWTELLFPLLMFFRSVILNITIIVKPILAIFLAVWIVAFLVRQFISSSISRTLGPICYIPGVSALHLPFCSVSSSQAGPVEFDQLMTVQSSFEDVMATSSGGVALPAEMKRSESSIRDLRHVVQFSTLPSRNELVFEFGGFIDTARQASAELTRFNSRIGRAVDNVLSTNRWTLQVIDGISEREASRGSISRLLQGTLFFPFQSASVTEDLLLDQYLRHTRAIEEQIGDLIIEAQALLGILQNLDDRLDVIHGITTRDGLSLKGSRDELLGQLWTKLGGNRSSKKKHDEQLHLLTQVSMYRKSAFDHVSGTLLKLQSIAAGLEDLRERVAAPDVLGPRSDVPLKMHIEHIQLGVERLEDQRGESRKLEGEQQRKILGRTDEQLQISQ